MFPSVECSELDGNNAPSGIRYMGNARDSFTWWYLSVSRLFFSLSVRAEPVTFSQRDGADIGRNVATVRRR